MSTLKDIAFWYWAVTGVLLAGAMAGLPLGFGPPIGLALLQTAHFLIRHRSIGAFPVQVRIGYLAWMLAGLWGPLWVFHWIQLAGTAAAVTVGYCPMARMLSLLPWNRHEPLSLRLVVWTFLRPPVRGSILDAP
jgi:hypothetical protein